MSSQFIYKSNALPTTTATSYADVSEERLISCFESIYEKNGEVVSVCPLVSNIYTKSEPHQLMTTSWRVFYKV